MMDTYVSISDIPSRSELPVAWHSVLETPSYQPPARCPNPRVSPHGPQVDARGSRGNAHENVLLHHSKEVDSIDIVFSDGLRALLLVPLRMMN
jgi:hypothetical protein